MILVIDAYNFLKYIFKKKFVSDSHRSQFIKQLGAYSKKKGHPIVLVFDGGEYQWPFSTKSRNITVVYSGLNESADDYIKRYLEGHKSLDLLLISTDRELGRFAKSLGVSTLDVQDFALLLSAALDAGIQETQKIETPAVKMIEHNQFEVDLLMLQSQNIQLKAEDALPKSRTTPSNKLSKKERKITQKLKKL